MNRRLSKNPSNLQLVLLDVTRLQMLILLMIATRLVVVDISAGFGKTIGISYSKT